MTRAPEKRHDGAVCSEQAARLAASEMGRGIPGRGAGYRATFPNSDLMCE
jgi:hypothetical protein